jgi:hypothetical protein
MGKWPLENEKLTSRLKNKTWTNPQIKNHKRVMTSDWPYHRHNTKNQKTHI